MPTPRYYDLTVARTVAETADATSFLFEIPGDLRERFAYRPGQFLTLRVPVAGRMLPRCYSMSSVPGLDPLIRVTVKRVADGRASNWLCDHLRAGMTVPAMPPAGLFTPGTLDGAFVLCAGGSGITPVLSILRSVLAKGSGTVRLFYANRDEASVIFRDELRALATAHPDRLEVTHWLDSLQGVPQPARIAALLPPGADTHAFICGPSAFMTLAESALEAGGLDRDRIHVERFVSLPEEGAEPVPALPPDGPAAGIEAEVELVIDGTAHRLRCGGGETILDAALRAGIAVPHSCRAGMCASCMCQVTEGAVHLMHNDVLDQRDLDRNWTLCCQAVPQSARVTLRFP